MMRVGVVLDDKYEILKRIGQGGMSVVYLAMDIRLNKQWAIKEIKQDGNNQDIQILLKSLQMEANVLKQVDHPVLPRIVDILDYEGTVFVVMDYIEGRPMSEVLQIEGAQPQTKVIEWAKELCSALEHLHSMNPPIIYRDMKPSNVMLKPDGKVKLIDFGTAKELDVDCLADTTALGTRGYAAPEQFGDASGRGIYKTDARTDIYNLGATLYHIVTGKNPSEPPYVLKPIRQWDNSLSSGLEKIINKCTMSNPEDRYQNCKELMYDLENYEKLDEAFKRACFRKMKSFLVSVLCAICFGFVSIVGYVGNEKEKYNNYESLLQQGFDYTVQGRYEDAVGVYVSAITEVDGSRNTAYKELLDLYVNYLDDVEKGLSRVTYYVDQKYQNIHKNQELLLDIAMVYFEVLKDYKSSAYYFSMLDAKEYPEADCYSTIAMAMSELDVDYNSLQKSLKQFEDINDVRAISVDKLMNYRLLCIVYARSLNQMDTAAQELIRVANKGLQLLDEYEDDSVKAEYYIIYNQYLSLAYEHLGEVLIEQDVVLAEQNYNKALECCDFILGMISKEDSNTVESITDYQLREAKYCQKAKIYEVLRKYKEASVVYEQGEKEFHRNSIPLYTGHLLLLCKIEEEKTTNIEKWDYEKLYAFYQEASRVPDISNDYRWKQLTQKLSPLLDRNGG